MKNLWYALRTHPYKEMNCFLHLEQMGFEVFYPRLRIKPVNPRSRRVRPFFPGYIFTSVDLEEVGLSSFLYIPYATGLVSFGGEPAVVPDHLIAELRNRVYQTQVELQQQRQFAHNEIVLIDSGPLTGFEAFFDSQLSGTNRVRLLLMMLTGRLAPVEISSDHIRKKPGAQARPFCP